MAKKARIFKIQLPLFTNADEAKALVYNERRSVMGEIPITPELKQLFPKEAIEGLGTPEKIFVRGLFDPDTGEISVAEIVAWEEW